jgi:putative DNA primase/helicase
MQEILFEFRKNNLDPGAVELDGKLHRFKESSDDKKKSGWYVGFQNFTNSGERFEVAAYGTWRTGETYKYISNVVGGINAEEKRRIEKQLKDAKDKAEKERLALQEEVSREVEQYFDGLLSTQKNKYFEGKKISAPTGTKTILEPGGIRTLIPMYDISGRLWGLQTIYDNGGKYFWPGQKVKGTFFIIGELTTKLVLCEGVATAQSIYEATGLCTVACFNAGNLQFVAHDFKKKYGSEHSFVVAGDDDQWRDDGKNPGRDAATHAAKVCLGKPVFPVFTDSSTKPTDFNDLFCLEGAEKVRSQILGVEVEKTK